MGLDAKIEVSTNGRRIMVVNVHPQTSMEAIADMLEDLSNSIRSDLKSKTPILTLQHRQHEIDTGSHSTTPPATFCGTGVHDLFNTAVDKFFIALDYADTATSQKYWDRAEKLYEWMVHNYTPEAIEAGPNPNKPQSPTD